MAPQCPECGCSFSAETVTCPTCGHALVSATYRLAMLGILVLVGAICVGLMIYTSGITD